MANFNLGGQSELKIRGIYETEKNLLKYFYVYLQETMSNLLRAKSVGKSGEKKFGLEKFARVTKKYGSDGNNGRSFGLDIS